MRRLRAFLPVLLALAATPSHGQAVVRSAAPDRVQVTVYRQPSRSADEALDLRWLGGYALISETRSLAIPQGDSEIRFEGVAGGIQPQSAIIGGIPGDIVERNRDAYLLSAGSLVDRSLGRRVHLRRTSRETGRVTEQEAIVRSGAAGAVVLETAAGFEALRCTGQAETLIYDQVPKDLSAKPTLSVRVHSAQAVRATITLSYLADGFDWQANYIAKLSADGSQVDLFAWLTLASSDETSLPQAETQAVAGRLNRDAGRDDEAQAPPFALRCWPQGRTSDIPDASIAARSLRRSSDQYVDAILAESAGALAGEDVVVTGSRIRAEREELGDLKLYRIAEPVTIAAMSQKQVAFLEQPHVRIGFVYRQRLEASEAFDAEPAPRFLLTRNRQGEGLGLPLPAGQVQLFADLGGRPVLLGEGSIADKAVGEKVEIALGTSPAIHARLEVVDSGDDWEDFTLTVANAQPVPIRYEAEFAVGEDQVFRPQGRLSRRDGRPLWSPLVPANGRASLRYRIVKSDG